MSTPLPASEFGAAYESALRDPGRILHLIEQHSDPNERVRMATERFRGSADDIDRDVIRSVTGPLLDIGCGPGRMVRAGILAGEMSLGIDISRAAVEIATTAGLPVLLRSVFQDLPGEGTWGAALLIDGNIGIGGDPRHLLERCHDLVRPGGRLIVEAHPDARRDRIFDAILIDDEARTGSPFPWAEIGVIPLRRCAVESGWNLHREWRRAGRSFAAYTKE
ncbi:class I SAM-dependent methyltransferase [Microbacteriaceae bacterium VKM Ac-2855]|nr:class I SAM-dependent methyltransferase [Microbacteriaceae bacterium VKM Ac-2855]